VSWHLPPLVDHPLCCVCCGCDAVTAASCSVDVDDCCWHQESSSTNNKTQPTPAEMQSNFHDVSNFVFSSPLGHIINMPQACHLQVSILNTCKYLRRTVVSKLYPTESLSNCFISCFSSQN